MLVLLVPLLFLVQLVAALGLPNVLTFAPSNGALTLASSAAAALPILYDSGDSEAIHIAVRTFAEDILRVTGVKPEVYADTLPDGTASAIIAATVGSALLQRLGKKRTKPSTEDHLAPLDGKWESFDARVVSEPLEGLDEALVVAGSDRVGVQLPSRNS